MQRRLASVRDTPTFCQTSQACLVNLRCISTSCTVKLVGAAEVAGALGLILPWLTGIARILTPAAAVGLALLQVGAAVFHGRRAEYKQWPVIAVFLAVAVFIAIVRISEGMR